MTYSMPELIGTKREGGHLSADELEWIIAGYTAVLDVACGIVVITQFPGVGGVVPAMYECLGLDPSRYKMAVVKTASNFQHFAPISSEVMC